ncbi:MAG: NAD(P)H-dependent oxidoreductase subunit E, partial [Burkholderiaceae bacterium]
MNAPDRSQRLLSDDAYARIDRELAKFPADQRQSAVMAALAIAQDETREITPEIERDIASYIGIAPIAVHEVATFYN